MEPNECIRCGQEHPPSMAHMLGVLCPRCELDVEAQRAVEKAWRAREWPAAAVRRPVDVGWRSLAENVGAVVLIACAMALGVGLLP